MLLWYMPATTMKLAKDTLERLQEHGRMGDSFEDVVNKLLDESEETDEADEDEEDEV